MYIDDWKSGKVFRFNNFLFVILIIVVLLISCQKEPQQTATVVAVVPIIAGVIVAIITACHLAISSPTGTLPVLLSGCKWGLVGYVLVNILIWGGVVVCAAKKVVFQWLSEWVEKP